MEVTSYELDIEELANLLAEKGFTTVSITLSTKLTQGKNEVKVSM